MNWKKSQFESSGVIFNYYTLGSGPCLLFLHGGGLNAFAYDRLLENLAENFLVIAPDIPAYGKKHEDGREWAISDYRKLFGEFIHSISTEDAVVVGHSLGGAIALDLALSEKSISSLILIDSAGVKPEYSLLKFRYLIYFKKTFMNLVLYKDPIALTKLCLNFSFNSFKNMSNRSRVVKTLKNCLYSNIQELSQLKKPTLIVWGELDEIFPLSSANILQRSIPNSKLEIVRGNHDWIFFDSTLAAKIISYFHFGENML